MVFKVGTDDAAVEKMRLAHEGVLSIPADGSTTTNGIHIGASADLKIYHESDISVIQSGHFLLELPTIMNRWLTCNKIV